MKIGIACNLKDQSGDNNEHFEEFDTPETILAISEVLKEYGYDSMHFEVNSENIHTVFKDKPDFVMNLSEGYFGRSRESHIPALLEMFNIPYSGSDPVTLGIALDKVLAKRIAKHAGVMTPGYKVVQNRKEVNFADQGLLYPLITKPSWEGSSKGIYYKSKSANKEELTENLLFLLDHYPDQPILVEEYISGKEVTVGVLGNDSPEILGLMEISNKETNSEDFFYSLEVKRNWQELVDYLVPPRIGVSAENDIKKYASLLFREFGCRDVARVDFKISVEGKIFFLEINPLPGLSPKYSDLVILARKCGLSYNDLIVRILSDSFRRYGFDFKRKGVRCQKSSSLAL